MTRMRIFLSLLASAASVAAQDTVAHVVGAQYTILSGGVCRGPGGGAHCLGYSYCTLCNGGECILFGPGLDGTCSDPSADNAHACEALGSCNSPDTATKEAECGVCDGKPSAIEESACESVSGTWKKATWTSAGAIWSGAEDPFTGNSHPSKLIAGTSDEKASDYSCHDIIVDDHLALCSGDTTECTTAFDSFQEDSDRIAEKCPEGCLFTSKPKGPRNPPVVHAPDIKLPGWDPAQSGACRGGADFSGKVNGKYSNTAGAAGGVLTQLECAEACVGEENCVGYAHSTAWCVVYGPDVHLGIGTEEGGTWTADNHEEVAITGTKVNIAYLCVTGPPRNTEVEAKKPPSPQDNSSVPTSPQNDASDATAEPNDGASPAMSRW
eukprot:CAMPEP_0168246718 /NCGR_PEP_ID=MMETSP0141_2-20121125/494_1 /TAXON_ID=44445 /ORGANISM="Pseudo-nitzschia australis, Strain 10249 10 AB" /LENGTH=380 /DNA_ID=CAMNT_0008182417 /DNA_START=23 /DNA_END=1162 /DNA_ORIENTATION=+